MADSVKSVDVPEVHAMTVVNPDGTNVGGGSGTGNGYINDGADTSIKATVKDLTNSNPLATALVDGNGDQITSFGGGTQYIEGDTDATITGTVAMVEGAANAVAPMTQPLTDTQLRATPVPVSGTVAVTNAGITTIAGAVSGTEMQVDVLTMPTTTVTATDLDIRPLVNTDVVTAELSAVDNAVLDTIAAKDFATQTTLAAINTKLVTGTDIGDVTINNSTGAAAVNIQDGGNTITVDGTVAVTNSDITAIKTAVEVIDNAIAGSEMQVDVVASLPAGTNAIGKLAANSGVDIGDVDVTSISAGTNAIGNVGLIGRATGGLTIFRSIDIDESEEEVKATAGQLFSISAFNTTAAPLYLKFYNATAANTTVGTTTPVLTFVVPGNADSDGAGFVWNNDIGLAFGTAISVACTGAVADNDTTAPSANACIINLGYV